MISIVGRIPSRSTGLRGLGFISIRKDLKPYSLYYVLRPVSTKRGWQALEKEKSWRISCSSPLLLPFKRLGVFVHTRPEDPGPPAYRAYLAPKAAPHVSPPSTILPNNYQHLQQPPGLEQAKQGREDSILRRLVLASLGDL